MRMTLLALTTSLMLVACVDSVCDNAEEICGRDNGENEQLSCSDDYECTSLCIVEQRSCDLRSDKVRACIGACVASGQSAASIERAPAAEVVSSELVPANATVQDGAERSGR